MRVPLLIVCAVLMAAGSGQAAIFGTWSTEDAGSGMDRWILTVTPTAGEIMAGFDIAIYDPTYGGNFQITTPLFKSTPDLGSSFLLNKSHTLPGTPPVKVTDLLVTTELQDTYVIGGAFATTGGPGAYAAGWSGPLQLAEIIVPRGSITHPWAQLAVTQSDFTGWPMFSRPDGSVVPIQGPLTTQLVTWTGGIDSTWSFGTFNWKATANGAPAYYYDNAAVIFDDSATSTTTVTINSADVTPFSVTFNNSSKTYTVSGTKGIAGATGLTKQGTGTTTLSGVNAYEGVTSVRGGTLVLQGTAKAMAPVLTKGGAQIKAGARLVLDYSGESTPAAAVASLMTTSYNAGGGTHFNTGKFQSTEASSTLALGWRDDTATKQISVALTRYGDASLDGTVNLSDLTLLGQNWDGAGKVWAEGDFDYDGAVNLSDLTLLGQNWNQSVAGFPTAGPSAVPEPGALLLLAAAAVGFGVYGFRKRRSLKIGAINMRVPLLIVCAVLMAAGSGQAAIFGTWSTEDAGGGMDRLILTVTPTAGEIMAGFDIAIYDPTYGGNFQITTPLFNATRDLGSSFLLNKSHTLPGTPPVKVTDLLVTNELQDTYVIGGAFATTGGPGAYAAGWSGPLQLAEIIVPRGSFTNPMTQLIVTQSDLTGMPMISRPDGSLIHFGPMQPLIVTWTGGSNSTWDSWHWGNWKTTDGGAPT